MVNPSPEPFIGTPPDIRINGTNLESSLGAALVVPGQALRLEYYPRNLSQPLRLQPNKDNNGGTGTMQQTSETQWRYHPASHLRSHLDLCAGNFKARLLLFPTVRHDRLSSRYPTTARSPASATGAYSTPTHFLQVNSADDAKTQLSPHFYLHQFLPNPADSQASAAGGWPKYTLLSFALLEKLELVVAVLAQHGKAVPTLAILSSYRSPVHNRKVGGATYSRHIYGDAVDFIVDADFDGRMDDLNNDGVSSRADLDWLTDRLARRAVPVSSGGTGSYESAGKAAAFLHLDARGRDEYWQ